MDRSSFARLWFGVTLVVVVVALVLQLVLVVNGTGVVDATADPVPLAERIRRLFSYFTIQSNILVGVAMFLLVTGRTHSTWFRVVRLASLIGITVTGIVAYVALQPTDAYTAGQLVCDRLLHIVVPLMTLIGWLFLGPRGLVAGRDVLLALVWPIVWLIATLGLYPLTQWVPYPFLRGSTIGWGQVAINCVVIAVLFFALGGLALWADRRLPGLQPRDEVRAGS